MPLLFALIFVNVIVLIALISLLASRTRALLAVAVPGVTPSNTPISAVVIVVLSNVRLVSPVNVPVTLKLPLLVIAPQPTVPNPDTLPLVSNV